MQEKFKDFQILHGKEEKVNPKLTAYQVELAQVEAEIEKLLDTLTGANATLLAYANKKIEELDTRRQTILYPLYTDAYMFCYIKVLLVVSLKVYQQNNNVQLQ